MTKRFSIKAGSSIGLSSIYTDNGKVMTQLEVLDVLIKQHETIQTLTKENEQLKHRLAISEKANFVTALEKENEHIKTTIKTMMDTERTELGRSVLKQLWEAIQ